MAGRKQGWGGHNLGRFWPSALRWPPSVVPESPDPHTPYVISPGDSSAGPIPYDDLGMRLHLSARVGGEGVQGSNIKIKATKNANIVHYLPC